MKNIFLFAGIGAGIMFIIGAILAIGFDISFWHAISAAIAVFIGNVIIGFVIRKLQKKNKYY